MIAFDIDGVIAKLDTWIYGHIQTRYNYTIVAKEDRTHAINVPGVTDDQLWEMFDHIVTEHVNEIQSFPEVQKALDHIYATTKQPIYFLTARSPRVKQATIAWLKEHIPVPHKVVFRGSSHKARHLQKRGFKIFVEDRLRTANEVAAIMDTVYLVNRPYNIGRPTASNVIRINSLLEIKV